jgi:hypothetical protein
VLLATQKKPLYVSGIRMSRMPGPPCSTVVILRDSGLTYAGLFRLIETAADLLAKQLANSYHPPTLCELVNDGLRTVAY